MAIRNERRGWYEICNHGSSLLEVHEAELVWLACSLIISVLAPLQGLKGFHVNTCLYTFVCHNDFPVLHSIARLQAVLKSQSGNGCSCFVWRSSDRYDEPAEVLLKGSFSLQRACIKRECNCASNQGHVMRLAK
jgi:hypothetical protein